MLFPLAAIATVFLGVWVLAVAIESRMRSMGKRNQKSNNLLPTSGVSLISLLLFLFTPTHFISSSNSLKFKSELYRSTD